ELSDGTYEQLYLWIDVHDETAKSDEIEMAFQYGRKLIVGDCKQLKTDVDSYNDNNKLGHYVEVDFNFEPDFRRSRAVTRLSWVMTVFSSALSRRQLRVFFAVRH